MLPENRSDHSGYYVLPLLSPGRYRVRIEAAGFQPQEIDNLELAVAGRLDIVLRLRPLSDVWENSRYHSVFLPDSESLVRFFGPDVDLSRSGTFEAPHAQSSALETSVSTVVGPTEIQELPLDGRDVYALIVLQPNITANTGTARGLNISVDGQRPSASNYLLDGVENNDYLVSLQVGKDGPKLKDAVARAAGEQLAMGTDGKPRAMVSFGGTAAGMTINAPAANLLTLVGVTSRFTGKPLVDDTGIQGEYNFTLRFAPEITDGPGIGQENPAAPSDPAPSLAEAVKQYGLRIETKRESIDMFVVTHVEKTAVEN